MKTTASIFLLLFTLILYGHAELTPADLRCDYTVNPLGVDSESPRLFWKVESHDQSQRQTSYQVLVSSSPALLARNQGDLWDSGKVNSDDTIQINYRGKRLNSSQKVFWKVRVWDANTNVSAWSHSASWVMGILKTSDWFAAWIGAADTNIPSLLLRREFSIKPGLRRALVNVCGLGQYNMSLDGKGVSDDFLSPGWTEYNKTCLYDTRDITDMLRVGKNAVGIELGNGMYRVLGQGRYTKFEHSFGPQKAIAQIRLEYADGSVDFIGTDGNWRVSPGPVTFSSIYGGESFDARLIQQGWNQPNFDDRKWHLAIVVSSPGNLRGLSCAAPPIRKFEIQSAATSHTLTNGDVVFDLRQNAAHLLRVSFSGAAGGQVQLFPSERTNKDGSVNQHSMGCGRRGYTWCDVTKGSGKVETWSPEFFYVGCRYVQVHKIPAVTNGPLPKIISVAGIVVHSASEVSGRFECSSPLFNRVFGLVRWAQQNNMMSIMTDCPHRERLGWLEQDHLNGPALRYDFELARLFTKTLNDIQDSQLSNGLVPTTAPEYSVFRNKNDASHLRNDFGDSPEWSSSLVLLPWQQYEFDGDLYLLRLHYDAMTNYVSYLGSRATNSIVNYGLGDWYDLGPQKPGYSQLTPIALTATAFYYKDADILAQIAALLYKTADAERFSRLAQDIRIAFNQKFYNETKHCYATDSQCANAIPLVMGICEPANRAAVLAAIIEDIHARNYALTAGDVGYRYLLRALAEGGRNDVIFSMVDQTNNPGYAMQLAEGKTSLTEAWDGGSSQDHFMLGQIQEWFYHDLAGIQNAPESPGFKHIVIAPQPVGDITWAKANFNSIRGNIVSNWRRKGRKFFLEILIPANTTALVYLPATSDKTVTESRSPASQSRGVKFLRFEGGRAIYLVASGNYHFASQY